MKKQITRFIFIFTALILVACGDTQTEEKLTKEIQPLPTEQAESNPLDSLHPEHISEDLSWFVNLDIQEGFLISYSITRQDGKEFEVEVDQSNPAIGGVDHPEPHFINDTTYLIPVVGGSPKGHYEMYIYENGTHEFKEIIHN